MNQLDSYQRCFELEGGRWIAARKTEGEQSWQRTAGIMSGADVKDFLLNLTSEYSRCASRAGNRGEKLHKLRRSL